MKFKIRRYFLLSSMLAVVVVLAVISTWYMHYARQLMIKQETQANITMTYVLSRLISEEYDSLLDMGRQLDVSGENVPVRIRRLDDMLMGLLDGSRILKVKIYNARGMTVYSTEHSQIGHDKRDNAGFQSALSGKPVSLLAFRDDFHQFEKVVTNRNLVSTYVPMRDAQTYEVKAVFELYSDVTEMVKQLESTRNLIITASLLSFLCALLGLIWVVQRGNRIITRQYDEILGANIKLEQLAAVFNHSYEGIVITDARARIQDVNKAFERISGYSREEAIGKNPSEFSSGRHGSEFYADMWESLKSDGYWVGEIWDKRKNGDEYAKLLSISAIHNENGDVIQYVGLFSDITEHKIQEQKLDYLAHYDSLTGLPNRTLFTDRLKHAISQSQRSGNPFAVAYLDLDGFKEINDNYGHAVGDELLRTLSSLIVESLREGDTFARLGGDEFVIILHDAENTDVICRIVERIRQVINRPVEVDGHAFELSVSIGLTFFPQSKPITHSELLHQADKAMYQAKQAGKNRYVLYNDDLSVGS